MTEEIKRCPHCQSGAKSYYTEFEGVRRYRVACTSCGMRGPIVEDDMDTSIAVWNTLMRMTYVRVAKLSMGGATLVLEDIEFMLAEIKKMWQQESEDVFTLEFALMPEDELAALSEHEW